MRRESWSIAFACALGAAIGYFAAGEIAARLYLGSYLWGVGALLGGTVAYAAVDFRHFLAGMKQAWDKAVAWRPYKFYWRLIGTSMLAGLSISSSAALILLFIVVPSSPLPNEILVPRAMVIFSGIAIFGFCVFTLVAIASFQTGRDDRVEFEAANHAALAKLAWIAKCFNPILLPIYCTYQVLRQTLRLLVWLLTDAEVRNFVRDIVLMIVHFVPALFVFIHSRRRTICFVDATIGAAVGYTLGSAILGAFAGAVIGVVNYEIVSVRIMRLSQAR